MNKKVLLVVGGVVVLGAGVVFYGQFADSGTPLGRITKVEKVESFADRIRAEPGHQLWLVHFDAQSKVAAAEQYAIWTGDSFLIDDTGTEYKKLEGTISGEIRGEGQAAWSAFTLLFSLPQGREPRYLRMGNSRRVKLPAP